MRILDKLDNLFKLLSEQTSRTVDRKNFLKITGATIFTSLMGFTLNPATALGASSSWCQVTGSTMQSCSPPNGKYCSGCQSSSKCPSGYKVSYAWGYASTGCWCYKGLYNTRYCCDCTLNNQYTRYSSDCGCSHYVTTKW